MVDDVVVVGGVIVVGGIEVVGVDVIVDIVVVEVITEILSQSTGPLWQPMQLKYLSWQLENI